MIEIRFKCGCMSAESSFEVRDRRDDEDVVDWMKQAVEPAMGEFHSRTSPLCRRHKCEYIMIPDESERGIGFPATRH